MKAIGLSGFAQSGKTTAANYIEQKYGFQRIHIATTLRGMCAVLLCHLGYSEDDIYDILEGSRKDDWIIPELGVTSRHLQITIGTEWGRNLVNEDTWVKTWTHLASQADKAMNDSVRFPNEERAIQDKLGGITILIERNGKGPAAFKWGWIGKKLYDWFGIMAGVHDSERLDRLSADFLIKNNGDIEDLHKEIDFVMRYVGIAPLPMSMRVV